MLLYKLIIESDKYEEIDEMMRRVLESREPRVPVASDVEPLSVPIALRPMDPIVPKHNDKLSICKFEGCDARFVRKGTGKMSEYCPRVCYDKDWYQNKRKNSVKVVTMPADLPADPIEQEREDAPVPDPVMIKPDVSDQSHRGRHPLANGKEEWYFLLNGKPTVISGLPEKLQAHIDRFKHSGSKIEWYCWACKKYVSDDEISTDGRHDELEHSGCGCYIK
jgi:hypothetical protein